MYEGSSETVKAGLERGGNMRSGAAVAGRGDSGSGVSGRLSQIRERVKQGKKLKRKHETYVLLRFKLRDSEVLTFFGLFEKELWAFFKGS